MILSKLVLDESKNDPELSIFRPAEYPQRPFFRRDLVAKVQDAKLSGIEFAEIDEFDDF